MSGLLIFGLIGLGLLGLAFFLIPLLFREVVETNEVHIVQSSKKTVSYGKDTGNGNTYYNFPAWLPIIGVVSRSLQTSVFDLDLKSYESYDKDRLPFVVDVKAFFRIEDSNLAAQRLESQEELVDQLTSIVQGAVRAILASHDIESILQSRSIFGDQFTKEVQGQLSNWGISAVKNIEFMDIRDSSGSQVISNIMKKRQSFIEMESRSEVAENKKRATMAEVEAQKEVDLKTQEAKQLVEIRTVQVQQEIALKGEASKQLVSDQEKVTQQKSLLIAQDKIITTAEIQKEESLIKANQDKELAVIKTEEEIILAKQAREVAEIKKESSLIEATRDKEVKIIEAEASKANLILTAEASKANLILTAEGELKSKSMNAEAIRLEGLAKAESEASMQKSSVQAEVELAREIGENKSYQEYLIRLSEVKSNQEVGIEQAKALANADIKIITNTGSPAQGISSIGELFSSKGGTELVSMMEGLSQTEDGKQLITKLLSGLGNLGKINIDVNNPE